MKQICEKCGIETEGYKMIINREPFFVCFTCKEHSKYIPFVHKNFNPDYAGIICPDFPGSHNSEYCR
ncbi:MAG: hypothetical protein PHN69_04965 [Candidatus Pacebacteria bacterium]|nr:hypothetical protein [Candidatus Paceibacterota bacterium]